MNYTFDFNSISFAPLLRGLVVSLELTVAANIIGVIAGFGLALLLMSPYRLLRRVLPVYAGDRPDRVDLLLRANAVRRLPRSNHDGGDGARPQPHSL